MSVEIFDNLFQFLSEHNFEVDENVPDSLKCEMCSKMLINSQTGSCFCKFCRNCADGMMNRKIEQCPGGKDECKKNKLSNFLSDNVSNFKISKLVLKCPNELCQHECELINMEEHFRVCSNKCIKCPFYGLGCDNDKLVMDKMGDHLQLEGFNHNKILIEINENLRNEVNFLKTSDERNKCDIDRNKIEIDMLNQVIERRKCEIEQNKDEIQRKRREIETIKRQIDVFKDDSIKIFEAMASLKKQNWITISVAVVIILIFSSWIQMENLKLTQKMEILDENVDKKMLDKFTEERQERKDDLGKELRKIKDGMEKLQLQLTTRTDEVDKPQDRPVEAALSWRVDQISDKRKKDIKISSEIFYPKASPYKMKLWMYNDAGSDELKIYLFIYDDGNDARVQWPFQRKVTIQISNQAHPNAPKTITQYCNVLKPDNNSFNFPDPFNFSYAELSRAGLIQNDYLTINCYI